MYYYPYYQNNQERGFWVPLILGGLGGAAIVGASRPRPVYVNPSYNQPYNPPYPSYGYNYYGGYNYPYYR